MVELFSGDKLWDSVIAIVLALAGGLARQLDVASIARIKWPIVAFRALISGLIGFVALLLGHEFNLSPNMMGVVCIIGGWTSPNFLYAVTHLVEKVFGMEDKSLLSRRRAAGGEAKPKNDGEG